MQTETKPNIGLLRPILLVFCLLGPPLSMLAALFIMGFDVGLLDGARLLAFTDFTTFYLVSLLVQGSELALLYDPKIYFEMSKEVLGFTEIERLLWYPPSFVLFLLPLATLPLLYSLAVWTVVNISSLLIWVWASASRRFVMLAGLAFPSSSFALIMGQNGCLTAALLGGGLLALERRPYVAGFLIGLATIKPQLGLLFPVALVAGREWRAFFAAAVTALALAVISIVFFGFDAWLAHFSAIANAGDKLQEATLPLPMMVTVLSLAHQFGLTGIAPKLVQAAFTLAMAVLVFWVWRRHSEMKLRVSVLIVAGYLATPFAYAYDLPLLALPLIWWAIEIDKGRQNPAEMILLAVLWYAPFLGLALVHLVYLQFWPFYFLVLLAIFCWRFGQPASVAGPAGRAA